MFSRGFISIGVTMGSTASADGALELFVCGRLCLLGEHSDWAGGFRSQNEGIEKGYCIVAGTNEGLWATVTPNEASRSVFTMTSTMDTGERRTRSFDLNDPASLLEEARAGGFWCHVAGTAHHMVSNFPIVGNGGITVDNHGTNLPVKKGLSSSAAVCVLVARAFSRVFHLDLTVRQEMDCAYNGERTTPSMCGKMDQACAFGPGKLSLLAFDGDDLDVTPIEDVGGHGFHFVLADLDASKDTVAILRDLQAAYPRHENIQKYQRLHELLGEFNAKTAAAAVDAIARGDAEELGRVYTRAQAAFDDRAGDVCPSQLGASGSPKLRSVINSERLRDAGMYGGKGVGSQGDGTVQLLCDGEAGMARCEEVLREDFGLTHTIRLVIPPHSSSSSRQEGS
jgi:galactokinase